MDPDTSPSPDLFFDTLTAYQKTAALKAAIDLDLFTALAEAPATAADVASRCGASLRGVRILCDYLTVAGFLVKSGETYALTPDSSMFLSRRSPAYAGGVAEFILSHHLRDAFDRLTDSVRRGGTAVSEEGSTAPEHPMWITFARSMGGLMFPASQGLAQLVPLPQDRPTKVLDVSASHGVWGIAFAAKNPQAQLVALDWAPVLEVAAENARAAGIADRFSTIAGSAFESDLGSDYDVVLVPNFLHHFNVRDCVAFLRRCHAALRPDGRVVIAEFVPNPDRVSPPQAAGFSLVMLATTPEGDAYTYDEFASMLADAGFEMPEAHPLPASVNLALVAAKQPPR
jgi:2-polyprenyl-3-methyl-5-hydroxy-6-metoxy-1,4-benzoquinol methylase